MEEKRLDRFEKRQEELYLSMGNLQKQAEVLEKDVSVLKKDVSVLKEDVSVLKEDVSVIKDTLNHHSDILGFVVENLKQLNENSESARRETLRLIEVLSENHRSEVSGVGDGVKANRERLDVHESRLESLEAS